MEKKSLLEIVQIVAMGNTEYSEIIEMAKKTLEPGPKPETEPVQIEGAPTVHNVLCIIDLHPDQIPEEFKSFIDDAPDEEYNCIAYTETTEHHQEHIYSNYAIAVKLSEVEHTPIVKETHEKIDALMAANDAAYFRLVY
jgi:hypothetical protein